MRHLRGTSATGRGKVVVLGVAGIAAAVASFAAPAQATPLGSSGDTTVTFTVGVVGGVSILPAPAVVGLPSGSTVTGVLASTVTDLRPTGGGWTDTVSSTDFALVGATSPSGSSLVPASAAKIWTTAANVSIPGTATINNVHLALDSGLPLSHSGQELLNATTSNVNVTALVSNLQIDVTDKATGLYTGTITQTVS